MVFSSFINFKFGFLLGNCVFPTCRPRWLRRPRRRNMPWLRRGWTGGRRPGGSPRRRSGVVVVAAAAAAAAAAGCVAADTGPWWCVENPQGKLGMVRIAHLCSPHYFPWIEDTFFLILFRTHNKARKKEAAVESGWGGGCGWRRRRRKRAPGGRSKERHSRIENEASWFAAAAAAATTTWTRRPPAVEKGGRGGGGRDEQSALVGRNGGEGGGGEARILSPILPAVFGITYTFLRCPKWRGGMEIAIFQRPERTAQEKWFKLRTISN